MNEKRLMDNLNLSWKGRTSNGMFVNRLSFSLISLIFLLFLSFLLSYSFHLNFFPWDKKDSLKKFYFHYDYNPQNKSKKKFVNFRSQKKLTGNFGRKRKKERKEMERKNNHQNFILWLRYSTGCNQLLTFSLSLLFFRFPSIFFLYLFLYSSLMEWKVVVKWSLCM